MPASFSEHARNVTEKRLPDPARDPSPGTPARPDRVRVQFEMTQLRELSRVKWCASVPARRLLPLRGLQLLS